jgi:hypothetical protein
LNDIHSKWTWHSNNIFFIQMLFTYIVFWVKLAKTLNYNQNQDHVLWQTFTKCSPFNFFLLYFNLMWMNILSTYTIFILRKPFFLCFHIKSRTFVKWLYHHGLTLMNGCDLSKDVHYHWYGMPQHIKFKVIQGNIYMNNYKL